MAARIRLIAQSPHTMFKRNGAGREQAESVAVAFLQKLRPGGPWTLTGIDPDRKGVISTITARTPAEVKAFIHRYDDRRKPAKR